MSDLKQAQRFTGWWFARVPAGSLLEIRRKVGNNTPTQHFFTNAEDALKYLEENPQKPDESIWFGLQPRKRRGGTTKDVLCLVFYGNDFDSKLKDDKSGTSDEVYSKMLDWAQGPLKCVLEDEGADACVITSGNCVQSFFCPKTSKPLPKDKAEESEFSKHTMALGNKLLELAPCENVITDEVKDVARVMRLPGFANPKGGRMSQVLYATFEDKPKESAESINWETFKSKTLEDELSVECTEYGYNKLVRLAGLMASYRMPKETARKVLTLYNSEKMRGIKGPRPQHYIDNALSSYDSWLTTNKAFSEQPQTDDGLPEPDRIEFERAKKESRYFTLVRAQGNAQTYIAVGEKATMIHVYTRHKKMVADKDGKSVWNGDFFWTADIKPLLSCGILVEKIARRNTETVPILIGKLTGVVPEIPFEKNVVDLAKFVLSEGRVKGSDITLKNAMTALVADIRDKLPEETALGFSGVRLVDGKLKWCDSTNSIVIASHPAALSENRKIEKRLGKPASLEVVKKYDERLKRFVNGLPMDWKANQMLVLGHGLMTHISIALRESGIAFGELDAIGPNRTTKTPQISVSNAQFGDGIVHTSAEVDTRFKRQTVYSRVGVIHLDEKVDDKHIELTKAQATNVVSAGRGQADGTMISTELVGVPQISSNSKPDISEDAGNGLISRNLILMYHLSKTKPDAHYASDLAYLTGDDAPLVGRFLIDAAIAHINEIGWERFTNALREAGTSLEDTLTFSKRSQTAAAAMFGADFIMRIFEWEEPTRKEILRTALHNAHKSDMANETVDSFIEFVRSMDEEYIRRLPCGKDEPRPDGYDGHNTLGGFYLQPDGYYLIRQPTIELWKKRRGERATKRALADFVQEMRRAGLEIEEPSAHRVNGELVWGAKTILSVNENILTDTNDDILTDTNNILTNILDVKTINVSINRPQPKELTEPSVCQVKQEALTPPQKMEGGYTQAHTNKNLRSTPTVSMSKIGDTSPTLENVSQSVSIIGVLTPSSPKTVNKAPLFESAEDAKWDNDDVEVADQ